LFVQTLRNLRTRDFGFAADLLLQAQIDPERGGYGREQVPSVTRQVLERLLATPGVESASAAHSGFGTGTSRTCCVAVEGYAHQPGEDREMRTIGVAPGYFEAIGVPLAAGRDFRPEDATDGRPGMPIPPNVIVNESFARRYLAAGTPIGRRWGWGNPPDVSYGFTIVGVVRDAIYEQPQQDVFPLVYFPSYRGTLYVVRARGTPSALVPTLRRQIETFDPKLEVNVRPVSDFVERAIGRERLLARLSAFFGLLAAMLAAVGVYGVMMYSVVQRTRELGIRLALGAGRTTVLSMEIQSALRLVAIGIAAGVPCAIAAGGVIDGLLFGVTSRDAMTLATVAAALTCLAAAAAWLPAHRASRTDPLVTLRYE
jgi:predicted permease